MGLPRIFKLLILFTLVFPLSSFAAAPSCGPVAGDLSKLPEGLFVENCKKLRASEACQRVEAKIKEAGNNPEDRLISCTNFGLEREKTLNENSLASSVSCLIGVAEFGIDTVVTVARFIGDSTTAIKLKYDQTSERNEKCEKDPNGKRKLFLIYNMVHPELLHRKIPSDDQLKQFSCNEIEFDLRKKAVLARTKIEIAIQKKMASKDPKLTDDEAQYVQWMDSMVGKPTAPSTPLMTKALDLIKEAGTEYWCYNGIRKRAMMCEAAALAASIYVGGQSLLAARAEKIARIKEISGMTSRIAKTETAAGTVSAERAALFLRSSGIKLKKVNIDGMEYSAIIPDKTGHWLARQADVYSRKYKTDFILVDPKHLPTDVPAQVFADGSRNYLMLANNLDFSDIPEVMGIISHELTHARIAAAATDASLKANPPMTLGKGSKDIPISGYSETLGLDEVQAYSTTAKTYRRSMEMARDTGDLERYEKFRKLYLYNKDKAVKIHQHTAQALERVKARVTANSNITPVDLGNNSWGIRINSGVKEGEEMMGIVLPKTPATNQNFRQELLRRIQTEIDSNNALIRTLIEN